MTRKRFDIIDVIVALIVGIILGIFAKFCFSQPSSEARFHCEGSGFIGLIEPAMAGPISCVGAARLSRLPLIFTVTAYCPCEKCCGKWSKVYPRKTASGHIIEPNDCFVAAPPWIPFGTKLSIPGYAGGSMVSVLDRGGKIKGNRLDVFFGDKDGHEKALAWGFREYEVVR